jgi:uncharacterized membrane protein YraQ (UPF0718 family)
MDFFEWLGYGAVYGGLGLPADDPLSGALAYFISDSVKVAFLLAATVFIVSMARTFITPRKIKGLLGGRREGVGNLLAALLGVPTPFCSCSAVPLFIGLVESGVPLGVTFSFLISSPMVNEVAVALLLGLFGLKAAALYVASGLAIAIGAGVLIGRLGLEGEVEDFVFKVRSKPVADESMGWKARADFALSESKDILGRVGPFIILGIALGAAIHGYAPVGALSALAGPGAPLAVPIAVLAGIPLYSNSAGMIPIVGALMEKGMALGTALAFMMSVTALSLPEMIILRKVLKPKLIAIFAGILALAFMMVGWMFNLLL